MISDNVVRFVTIKISDSDEPVSAKLKLLF